MIGILIASHGSLSTGLLSSLSMFFGDNLPQIDAISLNLDSSAEAFGKEMDQKIAALDEGDGVVIFCDMFGGTPCNQAIMRANERVRVICGVNLPMLMELVPTREGTVNLDTLIENSKNTIFDAVKYVSQDNDQAQEPDNFD